MLKLPVKRRFVHKLGTLLTICVLSVFLSKVDLISIPRTKAALSERNFTPRFTANINGDITTIGNVILTCPASSNCTKALNGTLDWSNNNFNMVYVDVDSDSTTVNSSSATLTIPSGASVIWASLYWGGGATSSNCLLPSCDYSKTDEVKIDPPGASGYTTVTAIAQDGFNGNYNSIADITSIVQAAGAGQYTVANVQAHVGNNTTASWTMAVVYKDMTQPYRNLNVYDGFKHVSQNRSANFSLNGFVTPSSGIVTAHIGFGTRDGDYGLVGDSLLLNSTAISDAINPTDNTFNSSISYLGTRVTNSNPNSVNTLGLDVDVIDASGIIPNNATSATVTLQSMDLNTTEAFDTFIISLGIDMKSQTAMTVSCSAKDTYTFSINSTTNLTSNVNKNFLYIAPRNTGGLVFQPQPGNTNVDNSIDKTINIGYEKSGTFTGMKYYTYSATGWSNTTQPYIKAANTKSNSALASPPVFTVNDRYYLTTNSFTSGQTSNWVFTVKFNMANTFFTNFYNNGFEAYLYMNDYTIMNFDLDTFTPISDCTTNFFGTNSGDFRSYEPGYNNAYSKPSSKFWVVSNESADTLTSSDYSQLPNPSPLTTQSNLAISDFSYEWKNPGTIDCQSKIGNKFCNDIQTPSITQKQMVQEFNNSISNGYTDDYFLRTPVLSPNYSIVAPGFYDSATKTIFLNKITTKSPVLVDVDSSITDITIEDSTVLTDTPDKIVVRSTSTKTTMRIKSIGYPTSVTTGSDLQVSYNNSTVKSLALNKTRIYLNYDLTTPSSSTINNQKKIILTATDTTKSNYYLGTMITSGLFYTSMSKYTDIVKGTVISDGVAARATGTTIASMYFKDAPNPFLFIDYDPKIFFTVRYLLAPVLASPRTYVGF